MNLKKQIEQRPWILALLVSLAVIIWLLSGLTNEDEVFVTQQVTTGTGEQAEGPVRVQVKTQAAEMVVRTISLYGQTAPARTVDLNTETDGRVISIGAERGERVSKGQVILRLDLRDRQARLEQARASVNEHETAYQAQLKLQSEGYVSDTQIAETLAKLGTAKAELTRAKLDLGYMVMRAPFDGVLQDRNIELGGFVRAGDIVGTFVDNTSIVVSGTIAEKDARYIALNETGKAVLATGQRITGRIRYISPVADRSTRTFAVELEVPNPDGTLPAGVTAEIELPGGEALAHKVSPSLLTLDSDGNLGLKIVDELNRVVFYPIELTRSESDGVWVTGLPTNANIITVGQGYVSDGQQVEPVPSQTETALAAERLK